MRLIFALAFVVGKSLYNKVSICTLIKTKIKASSFGITWKNYYILLGLIGLNNGYGIGSGSGSGNGGSGSNAGSGQQGACQSPLWEAKKEYEFEYHGRLLTGLPSLSSQYSGVGMRATVKVFAKAADVLVLKVEQPQYVDVNQVLHPKERGADMSYKKEGWNWRNLYLPTLKAVSISKPMFHI